MIFRYVVFFWDFLDFLIFEIRGIRLFGAEACLLSGVCLVPSESVAWMMALLLDLS